MIISIETLLVRDVICGTWSQWSQWSECSRTCDGGLANQRRRCIGEKISCSGPDIRYQHCNIQACAFDSRDLEDRICESNNRIPLNGIYYNWVPVSIQKYQCFVLCEDESRNIPNVIQTNMADGKTCGRFKNHYCLHGKCIITQIIRDGRPQCHRYRECSICSIVTGYKKSSSYCVDSQSGSEVHAFFCTGQPKYSTVIKECSENKCEPSMQKDGTIGTWRSCTAECGGGTQSRRVTCSKDSGRGQMVPIPSYRCPDPIPISEKACNTQFCPARWITGDWTEMPLRSGFQLHPRSIIFSASCECSVTCGIGIQTRTSRCVKTPVHGISVNVSDMECFIARPSVSRSCSKMPCLSNLLFMPSIETDNTTFIQYKRVKRIYLNVGEKATLLRRQPVKISCPVRNFNKQLLMWSKNNRFISMARTERVYVSQNGALKIKRTDPDLDAGIYTCIAGSERADVAMRKIKNMMEHMQTGDKLDYLINKPQNDKAPGQAGPLNLVQEVTPFNTKAAQSMFMTGDWSTCSRTCGPGTQTRKVTCSILSNSYVKIVADKECTNRGIRKPDSYRRCSLQSDCPSWVSGEWSEIHWYCSSRHCKSEGVAIQRRPLSCQNGDGTTIPISQCNPSEMPVGKRECRNTECVAVWHTSKWTKSVQNYESRHRSYKQFVIKCKPRCSKKGKKTRIISCVWKTTKKHANTNCKTKARPHVWKRCKPAKCKKGRCHDHSKYCSLVGRLRMCRYSTFKTRCCSTCSQNSVLS
ncbi:hypothetical protein KUTeg_017522 [Tegillarca granosa]|uniref:ADAMTS-like protein 1 n=1 Tax=Tegillarca granosa TaxID=220873 RepID=A0ABQ9EF66_TEGGR|nr:hypothetical protein KUTeg_017522 [Tegillarca granosa]